MNFIKRFQNVLRSNLNSLVDSIEDPEKILDLFVMEMKEQEKQAKKRLLEIKTLKQQSFKDSHPKSDQNFQDLESELQQTITQFSQKIEEAKKKRLELSKKIMKAKLTGKKQELKSLSQIAKDYVHDTSAFDTYARMEEKIDYNEAYAKALEELVPDQTDTNTPPSTEKETNQIEAELAALKKKLNNKLS